MMWRQERGYMVEGILSRVAEKLSVVLIQQPGLLNEIEEEANWIYLRMSYWVSSHLAFKGYMEPLRDIAYDVEDVVDDFLLKPAAKRRRRGGILKKLKQIRVNIYDKIRFYPESLIRTEPVEDQNIANTVVSPVIEKVIALLGKGLLRPQVKKKARRILDEFKFMNGFLEDVESVELDENGMAWMEELCNVSCYAVDVIDSISGREQFRMRGAFRRVVTGFNKLRSQLRLGAEMDQINARILVLSKGKPKEVIRHGQSREQGSERRFLQRQVPPPDDVDNPDMVSFEDDVHEIVARLPTDDKCFFIISIVGVKGIGKTTLTKLVHENDMVVDHFPYRARLSVGSWDLGFVKDILEQMGCNKSIPTLWKDDKNCRIKAEKEDEKEEDESELLSCLNAFLQDKKYLIILDVRHGPVYLEDLLRRLPDTSNGSRMILTSRPTSLHSDLPNKSLHLTLQLRDDNESWALFRHTLKVSMPPELLDFQREIVRICGGLPLAIKNLADVLSKNDTTIEAWSSVLQQLNRDQEFWSETLTEINNSLPLHMKRCLFYFRLFPQNFEIPGRRLILLWVAEGLVHPMEEKEAPEAVAERYLTKLIGQCMVQVTKKKLDGRVQACCLPDPIRRHWLLKAKEATFLQGHKKPRSSEIYLGTGMVHRLADHLDKGDDSFNQIHGYHNTSSISLQSQYQDTTSFLSFDTREGSKPGEDIGNFLDRCISNRCLLLLRVLDLELVYKPKLPEALELLRHLRYLGLRWTKLDMLPSSVGKLLNLQTLDVKHTDIRTLPNSIWSMQQLRNLYLSENYCSMPQPSSNSLTTLQTLWGLLVNLRKLGLAFCLLGSQQEAMLSQVDAVADWVLKLNHLQSLRLKSYDEKNQPWDMDLKPLSSHANLSNVYLLGQLKNPSIVSEFAHSLTDLTLSWSGLEEDPMQTLDKLPKLRVLRLLRRAYVGKNMLCSSGGFPELQVLKLWMLEQLEEWNVEKGALLVLRDLEVRSCIKLDMLPEELQHRTFLKLEFI
ncbi:hypothetical protein PVL29_006812 [Vitis rotundifolia]|uniref:Uncharacterized protein n=1 Tax=Vitis rotundifolia TaxID=103349 RepID=A0AA39DZB6_VITRO|nr:hypothetical protein PVL29_006812 [Vitis rotundifolia]